MPLLQSLRAKASSLFRSKRQSIEHDPPIDSPVVQNQSNDPPATIARDIPGPSHHHFRPSDSPSTVIRIPEDSHDHFHDDPTFRRPDTFRSSLDPQYPFHPNVDVLCNRARWAACEMLRAESEPALHDAFSSICREVVRPDPTYNPFPQTSVEPRLEFARECDLGYLAVQGGKELRDTTLDRTVEEMYAALPRGDPSLARTVEKTISRPDHMLIASTLPPKVKGIGSSTTPSSNAAFTTESKVAKRTRKRKRTQVPDDVDQSFCATSLVVELKLISLFRLLCQLIAYLIQAYEMTACRLGLLIYQECFARLLLLEENTILMETNNSVLWDKVNSLIDVKLNFNNRNDYCAHRLGVRRAPGRDLRVNENGLRTLIEFLCTAVSQLIDQPFNHVSFDDLDRISKRKAADMSIQLGRMRVCRPLPPNSGVGGTHEEEKYVIVAGARNTAGLEVVADRYPHLRDKLKRNGTVGKIHEPEDGRPVDDDHGDGDDQPPGRGGDKSANPGRTRSGGGKGDGGLSSGQSGSRSSAETSSGGNHSSSTASAGNRFAAGDDITSHRDKKDTSTSLRLSMWRQTKKRMCAPLYASLVESDNVSEDDESSKNISGRLSYLSSDDSSSEVDTDEESDDLGHEPAALDPIYCVLARLGIQVKFCSPGKMTAMIRDLASTQTSDQLQGSLEHTAQRSSTIKPPCSKVAKHDHISVVGEDVGFADVRRGCDSIAV